ncbi:MAG: MFS transporter [Betaproteobacteria bacterium]|nr:MFS transporter [Betaproteobacteria bacterium]
MAGSPLAIRDFRLFLGGRFCANLAQQMLTVAIGYYLYDATGDALVLGYAALAIFIPGALLTLPAGDLADRFDRRHMLGVAHAMHTACAALFLFLVLNKRTDVGYFYAVLVLSGVGRALAGPAVSSFAPFLVPREIFGQAVAWSTSTAQVAVMLGPALGGLVYLAGPWVPFAACCVVSPMVMVAMLSIRTRSAGGTPKEGTALSRVVQGLRYLRRQPIVLGAITLDLFAVMLGSVTALLPVYARDILHVGPDGLGVMRSAIAVGAVATGLALAHLPAPRQPHAGTAIFGGVAVFGAAAMVFGFSTSFALSIVALLVMGSGDMLSVFVRGTVVQLGTPAEMRGRVSSVHFLFVGAANEFGDFRAGMAAAWLGAVPAALAGGACTLAIVALWTRLFPELRRINRLADIGANRA